MPAYSWVPRVIPVTPLVSATPDYSIGDSIGGKIEIPLAMTAAGDAAVLESLFIVDKSNVKPTFDLVIFESEPLVATLNDNATLVLSTDATKVIARIPVTTVDYVTLDVFAFARLAGLGQVVQSSGGTSLWFAMDATAAANLNTTSDLKLLFGFV